MRNPLVWITLATTFGPLLIAGTLFIPVAAALAGAAFQWEHVKSKAAGIAPGLWICGAAAVLSAFFIYPSHFDSVAKCDAIAAGASLVDIKRALGIEVEDDTRLELLEAGCNSLPFYAMPDL